jgi:hypothetical protein
VIWGHLPPLQIPLYELQGTFFFVAKVQSFCYKKETMDGNPSKSHHFQFFILLFGKILPIQRSYSLVLTSCHSLLSFFYTKKSVHLHHHMEFRLIFQPKFIIYHLYVPIQRFSHSRMKFQRHHQGSDFWTNFVTFSQNILGIFLFLLWIWLVLLNFSKTFVEVFISRNGN